MISSRLLRSISASLKARNRLPNGVLPTGRCPHTISNSSVSLTRESFADYRQHNPRWNYGIFGQIRKIVLRENALLVGLGGMDYIIRGDLFLALRSYNLDAVLSIIFTSSDWVGPSSEFRVSHISLVCSSSGIDNQYGHFVISVGPIPTICILCP